MKRIGDNGRCLGVCTQPRHWRVPLTLWFYPFKDKLGIQVTRPCNIKYIRFPLTNLVMTRVIVIDTSWKRQFCGQNPDLKFGHLFVNLWRIIMSWFFICWSKIDLIFFSSAFVAETVINFCVSITAHFPPTCSFLISTAQFLLFGNWTRPICHPLTFHFLLQRMFSVPIILPYLLFWWTPIALHPAVPPTRAKNHCHSLMFPCTNGITP